MLEYINNPNVVIINVLSDDVWSDSVYPTCEEWGDRGIDDFPIILDDLDDAYNHVIGDWFGVSNISPYSIFIDHNFEVYAKYNWSLHNIENTIFAEDIIEEMLENLNEE